MGTLRILFLGDIVGSSGRDAIRKYLPELHQKRAVDFIIANGENAAHGFGLTPTIAKEIFDLGIDVITGGNHTWDKKEGVAAFHQFPDRLIRPANYPPETTGKGWTVVTSKSGHKIGVINLMGRIFMDPLDCPFQTFKKMIETVRKETKVILLDFHGEATSEKYAMANYVDGQVSAMVGTHTHVQTADDYIFPKGTGYLSDAGMNGPLHSIIGMKTEIILQRFLTKLPHKMEVAEGPGMFHGVIFEIDSDSGKCQSVERIRRLPD